MNFVLSYLRRQFPDTPTINTIETEEILENNDNILILDVRKAEEYNVSKIPSAQNLNFKCSDTELKEILTNVNNETQIINYCSLGYRSAIMTNRIREMVENDSSISIDRDKVFNLEGSIFKWANENRPLIDPNGQTTR